MSRYFSKTKHHSHSSEEENALITKGEDIMSDIEKSMPPLNADSASNCHLMFMRSLRKNIDKEITTLNRESSILNCIDWLLFFTSLICTGLISCGINFTFRNINLDLTQIFGVIALVTKSFEKSANLSRIARDKKVCANTLAGLMREISLFELEIYSGKEHSDTLTRDILTKVNKIWTKYDDIGLKSFAQPSFEESKKNYGSFSPPHHEATTPTVENTDV